MFQECEFCVKCIVGVANVDFFEHVSIRVGRGFCASGGKTLIVDSPNKSS